MYWLPAHNSNNDHQKRGSSYVVLYRYLCNLDCGILLSRLTEAACGVSKLYIHACSMDIYFAEKHHYIVLQRMLINVYLNIWKATSWKILLWTRVIYIYIYIYTPAYINTGTCGRNITLMSPSIWIVYAIVDFSLWGVQWTK